LRSRAWPAGPAGDSGSLAERLPLSRVTGICDCRRASRPRL